MFHASRRESEHGHYTCLAANNRQNFFASLYVGRHGQGGFIHEVDPAPFTPIGAEDEWVARQTVAIIAPPRFVTIEDVMRKGVQIFISVSPDYKMSELIDSVPASLIAGHAEGTVIWLNQEYGINMVEFKPLYRQP